jgi:hypothetical protein
MESKKEILLTFRCNQCIYKMHNIKKNFQIFNVGTSKPISVNHIVKLLAVKV